MVFLATENGSVVSGLDAQLPPSPNAHYIIVSEAAENFKFQSLDLQNIYVSLNYHGNYFAVKRFQCITQIFRSGNFRSYMLP